MIDSITAINKQVSTRTWHVVCITAHFTRVVLASAPGSRKLGMGGGPTTNLREPGAKARVVL